ncbi:hypothetical protein [Thermaerobacillus caldiproteolyticus]|uniref:hypothetical protein n=1 Tax=Thermaerobacillus caldiproteolyticus TaxID=247480 RepID=UPI00188B4851|nr:hypothetical protein [Anoxybacillus caldiproteolyticus]QPA33420.1 hypothetical protein ISX45_19050 [Anoxybacillus caldiproteolyticus]
MHREIRKGVTQAEFNEDASKILFGEIFIISVILGAMTHSWWVFGVCFIGLIACIWFEKTAFYLAIILSIGWGILGFLIGLNWIDNTGAAVVLSILGLLCGLGVHMAGLEYTRDIAE